MEKELNAKYKETLIEASKDLRGKMHRLDLIRARMGEIGKVEEVREHCAALLDKQYDGKIALEDTLEVAIEFHGASMEKFSKIYLNLEVGQIFKLLGQLNKSQADVINRETKKIEGFTFPKFNCRYSYLIARE